jgi:hypothetical protein
LLPPFCSGTAILQENQHASPFGGCTFGSLVSHTAGTAAACPLSDSAARTVDLKIVSLTVRLLHGLGQNSYKLTHCSTGPSSSFTVHSPYDLSRNLGDPQDSYNVSTPAEVVNTPSYLERLPRLDLPSNQAAGFDLGNPNFLPLPTPSSFLPQPHFRLRQVNDLVTSLSLNDHPEDQTLPPLQLTRPGGFHRSINPTGNLTPSASLPRLPPLSTKGRVTLPPLPPLNSNPSGVCRNLSTASQRATSLRLPSLASFTAPQYSIGGLGRAPPPPDLHDGDFSINASTPSRRARRPSSSFENLPTFNEHGAGSTGLESLVSDHLEEVLKNSLILLFPLLVPASSGTDVSL